MTSIVKSGFFIHKRINLELVKMIAETNSIIGSPAASLDRLEIIYDNFNSILISPKDKYGFIDHATSVNPQIEVRYKSRN